MARPGLALSHFYEVIIMQCPLCGTSDTGKVGTNQYYCWECLLEFRLYSQEKSRMFYVESDGSLIPLASEPEQV